jgi:hypothetical protein
MNWYKIVSLFKSKGKGEMWQTPTLVRCQDFHPAVIGTPVKKSVRPKFTALNQMADHDRETNRKPIPRPLADSA